MTAKQITARKISQNNRPALRIFVGLALCALLLSTTLVPATAMAQAAPSSVATGEGASGLQVENRAGALHLHWQAGVQAATTDNSATTSYAGYLLPLQTVTIELTAGQAAEGASAAIAVQSMSSAPYDGTLTLAPTEVPPALDYMPTPLNTPYVEPALPQSPVFVIAEGSQRGRHFAVVGFSPIYQDANSGEILYVDSLDASVAGANVAAAGAMLADATADPSNAALFAPVSSLAVDAAPTNPLANAQAYKIFVSNQGLQQLSGADLAGVGLNNPIVSNLRVFYLGSELPLHIIDNNGNNQLNADDYVRFYAPAAGDTWNTQSVYWLTSGPSAGLRMELRGVAPAGATARTTAYEVGRYQHSSIYEMTLAGADGDNWFQANLIAEGAEAEWSVDLPHQLPLNDALPTLLTLNMTPYLPDFASFKGGLFRLQFNTSGFSAPDEWLVDLTGSQPFTDTVRTVSLGKGAATWSIKLLVEAGGRAILFDAIDYLLPVELNFGSKGATFQGIDGAWTYQLSGTPTAVTGGRGLYDITNPLLPQQLNIPGDAGFIMQDGPSARRYVMSGEGTLFNPTVQAHAPVNLGGVEAAHVVYIAPAQFHSALQPLVALRQQQGYTVRVVDVQAIYDAWSFGMVDAKAIRNFLQLAVGTWSPAPIAAVLVGDGTSDPLNFKGNNNPNHITPYIANVDPWIKYVPCESCFGQLDGDTPTQDYLLDIWIGRFPVATTAELHTVVDKIVKYETDTNAQAQWRGTSVQIADDDVRPDNTVDPAVNPKDEGPISFVGSAEHVVSLMPTELRHLRNYYMAATDFSAVPNSLMTILNKVKSWFIADADLALRRSITLMNNGAGLVTFTGHSNHWQWARVVKDGDENRWMFGLNDVSQLRNLNAPFISMSMTCYTSQFTEPAPRHFTLDERLFLHGNGGAISTWGPTGFSVVSAHDVLQEGFHTLLWKSPKHEAKLGALYAAGYQHIFNSPSHHDVNKTYAVFGDPLTSARISPSGSIFMPRLGR